MWDPSGHPTTLRYQKNVMLITKFDFSVAIPLNARFLGELFSLNVKTSTDTSAAHTSSELYKLLIEVSNWVDYPNADQAVSDT